MTAPPLPASPCVRVRLDYTNSDTSEAGSRFYLGYSGSAPSAANCVTLATDIKAAWATNMASLVSFLWGLTEVDVLDIATDSGASGTWTGNEAGTIDDTLIPSSAAGNVEFQIARRYRGGKPRMFVPSACGPQLADAGHWTDDYVTALTTGVTAFMAEIEALTIGAMGVLTHVNLSYYKGFTNIINSSGRERAVPTYRDAALLDTITGYAGKKLVGSQKRRRNATTY